MPMLRLTEKWFSRTPTSDRRSRALRSSIRRRRVLEFDHCEARTLLSTGAIFTTISDGTTVNGNIYDTKAQVYLNGGPQNQNAQGLDPGYYLFQVTTPDWHPTQADLTDGLLSSDPAVDRVVHVGNGGRFDGSFAASSLTATFQIATTSLSSSSPPAHPQGTFNFDNGQKPVQLAPFNNTDNPGGEYKAWLISINTATIDDTNTPVIHFTESSDVKTDNFKVKESLPPPTPGTVTVELAGLKYCDENTNGVYDPATEHGLKDFVINSTVTLSGGLTFLDGTTSQNFTDTTGTTGAWGSVFVVNVPVGGTTDGHVSFTTSEVQQSPWMQTGPIVGATIQDATAVAGDGNARNWEGTLNGGHTSVSDLNFGNIQLGAGGGLTLGFWSNKNGAKLVSTTVVINKVSTQVLTSKAQGILDNLNLADANGALPTSGGHYFADYTSFRNWLLNATATNMSYMTSVQMAVMKLNVEYGFVSGSAMVYAPELAAYYTPGGSGSPLNANSFISIDDLLTQTNNALSGNLKTIGAGPTRTKLEIFKNILDGANNNLNFAFCP
jgi:hypothetical protein